MRDTPSLTQHHLKRDVAVVHRLPYEVIAETFLWGLATFEWDSPDVVAYLNRITAVCSMWRHMAIGTPQLWTGIVHARSPISVLAKVQTGRLDAYIKRSQVSPLDVKISFEVSDSAVTLLIDLIHTNAYRLRSLATSLPNAQIANALFPLPPATPHLRALAVTAVEHEQAPPEPIYIFSENGVPPPLRDLRMEGLAWWDTSRIPARALESVNLIDLGHRNDAFTRLLPRCTSATSLQAIGDRYSPLPEFELGHLKSLMLYDTLPLSFPLVFSTPQLDSLTILVWFAGRGVWSSPACEVVPTWPSLVTLTLRGILSDSDIKNARKLLKANPTISYLGIQGTAHLAYHARDLLVEKAEDDEDDGCDGGVSNDDGDDKNDEEKQEENDKEGGGEKVAEVEENQEFADIAHAILPNLQTLELECFVMALRAGSINVVMPPPPSLFGETLLDIMRDRPNLRAKSRRTDWCQSDVTFEVAKAEVGDRLEEITGGLRPPRLEDSEWRFV